MILRIAGALLLATVASAAMAKDTPTYAPAPDWVTPAPASAYSVSGDRAPLVLVLDQQTRIGPDGKVRSYTDRAFRIASPAMRSKLGTVTLNWQPDQGDLIIHKAEIIRDDTHIDLLDKDDAVSVLHREAQMEKLQINGILTATLTVDGLRVGDVLRVVTTTTRRDDVLNNNAQTAMPLPSKPARIGFARTRLSWPKSLDLHWRTYIHGLDVTPAEKDGYEVVDVPVPLAKPDDVPGDAPKRFQRFPVIEASTFDDWQAVSAVMAPLYLTDAMIAPDSPLAKQVAGIEAASDDPRERAAKALRLVQDKIRYLFKGLDGGNYQPQAPAKTWNVRYGDCKAKTLLLLAMLHAMDIEAEPVLASSQLGDLVDKRLPSAAAFDHVLVRADIGGKTLWLDGTRTGDRLPDLTDTPDFERVLPIRADGATLATITPEPDARPDVRVAIDMDDSAGIDFPAPYDIVITTRGPLAEQLHSAATQANDDQADTLVTKLVGNFMGNPYITDHDIAYDDDAGTTTISASGVIWQGWKKQDDRYGLPVGRAMQTFDFDPDRSRAAWQDIPVARGRDASITATKRIVLPDDGAAFTLSGAETLPKRIANTLFSRKAGIANGTMTVVDHIEPLGGEVAPGDIAAARKAYADVARHPLKLNTSTAYPPHWKRVEQGLSAKRFQADRKALGDAIAKADDDEAQPYINRARFRSQLYDWKSALTDVDKVIALKPSAEHYRWRAGLRARAGDYAEAMTDIDQAESLDPGASANALQRASLYIQMDKPGAAVSLIEQRLADGGGGDDKNALIVQKSEALARAGKAEAAFSTIDDAIAGSPGNPLLLNQRCWLKGTLGQGLESALKDCTKSIELAEQPAAELDSRAMVYFRMDRLDDALADLNAALDIAPGQSDSMFLRGIIRTRLGDAEDGAADIAAARMIQPDVDDQYARYGVTP